MIAAYDILLQLCSCSGVWAQGSDIRRYISNIPRDTEPPPIIHAYVDLNLNILKSHHIIPGPAESSVCPMNPHVYIPDVSLPTICPAGIAGCQAGQMCSWGSAWLAVRCPVAFKCGMGSHSMDGWLC